MIWKNKKFILVFFSLFILMPTILLAQFGPVDRIVPECLPDGICNLCHLYQLANNIIRFLLYNLGIPIVTIMLLYGGFLLMTSGGNEEQQKKGKEVITSAFIGLFIAFSAFLIINTIVGILGFELTFLESVNSSWYQFPCEEIEFFGGGGTESGGGGLPLDSTRDFPTITL